MTLDQVEELLTTTQNRLLVVNGSIGLLLAENLRDALKAKDRHAAAIAETEKQREADREIQQAALAEKDAEIERLRVDNIRLDAAEALNAENEKRLSVCELKHERIEQIVADKDRRIAELEKRVCGGCGTCERERETLRAELAAVHDDKAALESQRNG